jgi:predicted ATPase
VTVESFGKYQVLRRLGAGGMAEVFLAREPLAGGLSKLLVIKKIHSQLAETPQFRQMFEDEAKVAVNLNHPNVVQTFGYGQIGPTLYLAMEHVEGVDLLRLLNATLERGERIPFGLCAYLGQQVAKGLDYAHRRTDEYGVPLHIVHRDISPQNILVSWDGMVKIVDFGIARARHVKEVEGVVKGKFAYMSPEQAAGDPVDTRSDIFSMGIVLWELSTNRSLFGGMKGKHALAAIRAGQFQRPRHIDPAIPVGLEDIILRALALRPEDRFQTSRDLHRALGKFFFELSAKEGQIFESGAMAAFMARIVAREPLLGGEPEAAPPAAPAQSVDPRPRPTTDPQLLSAARPIVVVEGELSGMSALRRSVGDSRAREVLLDFLRVTEHVAYKHSAHADHIDERGFAYIIGLSGGSEEDPVRAIRLSLALIEALEGISRDLQPPLQIAIGIQRGSALVAPARPGEQLGYQLVGHTTTVARELSREAMPGEVLVGGGVYRAARAEYRFEEIESIDLPADEDEDRQGTGRAHVYRLAGLRARAERLAAPAANRSIIGRDRELEALRRALRSTLDKGRAHNVLLLGDAGVGKTSIVEAFRRTLPADAQLLRASARPSLRDTPFSLVADIGRDALGVTDDAEPREIKRRIEAAIDALFADGEGREARQAAEAFGLLLGVKVHGAEEIDPSERRHRLYNAMRKVQQRMAQQRPLIVIIEDMHWADAQSFELFSNLLREPLDRPALGIATSRPDERVETWALDPASTAVYVSELGLKERETLVDSRFADPVEARPLTRQILERAGGNPFFVHELLESLTERGVLAANADGKLRRVRRDEAISVPTTVEAVVASRLDRLPALEQEVLRRAAVLGRVVRGDDLAALVPEHSPGDVAGALERLCARGILEQPAERGNDYAFRNLLTKEIAYGGIAPELRARLHKAAAERIASSPHFKPGADDRPLAEHLIAAGARAEAGTALLGAAVFARDNASNADAFTLLTRALQLLPPDAHRERYALHAEREQILRGWGKRPAQLREVHFMRRAATAAHDTRGEIEALCRLGLLYLDVGRHTAARRELDAALELARRGNHALAESEALRLLATLSTTLGKNGEALELARQALAILDPPARAGVPPAPADRETLLGRAQALQVVGNIHVLTGRLREAVSTQAEALVIYRRLGARRLEAQTLSSMGWVLVGLGEFEEALVQYKRSLRLAQDLGDRAGIGAKLASIGQAYGDLGDLERAHRYLGKALELHNALQDQPGLCDARISLAQVHLKELRYEEALGDFRGGLELAVRTRNRYQEIRAMVYIAFTQLERGDPPQEALELAQGAVRLAREGELANGEVYGLSAEALAHLRSGDVGAARKAAAAAVSLLDAGRDVDSPEEILFTFAEVAEAAGARSEAHEALLRAAAEVRKKARRIRDLGWRTRYLEANPAKKILDRATESGAILR